MHAPTNQMWALSILCSPLSWHLMYNFCCFYLLTVDTKFVYNIIHSKQYSPISSCSNSYTPFPMFATQQLLLKKILGMLHSTQQQTLHPMLLKEKPDKKGRISSWMLALSIFAFCFDSSKEVSTRALISTRGQIQLLGFLHSVLPSWVLSSLLQFLCSSLLNGLKSQRKHGTG